MIALLVVREQRMLCNVPALNLSVLCGDVCLCAEKRAGLFRRRDLNVQYHLPVPAASFHEARSGSTLLATMDQAAVTPAARRPSRFGGVFAPPFPDWSVT